MIGLEFPQISPIIFSIGPLAIRWYSMAYLVGIVAAWFWAGRDSKRYQLGIERHTLEDIIFYVTIGIIIGGRIGYVLFYGGDTFKNNPWQAFAIWNGGMSFHGGATGAVFGILYAMRKCKIDFWQVTDLAALYAPIGIFLGRIANFVNDELWGRVTDVPWAVRFPSGGYLPRHPSQLYEALGEGLIMFIVLNILWRFFPIVRQHKGFVSGLFVLMYAGFRIVLENFRQPDAQLGFYFEYITMGQMLSMPLILLGIWAVYRSLKLEK